jgi:D-sedoheptulose 7-phosphate isomerase
MMPPPKDALAAAEAAFAAAAALHERMRGQLGVAVAAAQAVKEALARGGKVLVFGNGGSASDAQHFAGELMGHFLVDDRRARPAIALAADSAVVTCIANDYAFADVFARQVRGLAQPGDVLVGISTSGRSENVLRAFAAAPEGVLKIALTGPGGPLGDAADVAIRVPADATAPMQAAHISIIHAICAVLEERFAEIDGPAAADSADLARAA